MIASMIIAVIGGEEAPAEALAQAGVEDTRIVRCDDPAAAVETAIAAAAATKPDLSGAKK